ncbi:MAG: hypothetical protein M1834_004638 [Cirrosporium novae-zelandiae]|nr:MAG: hypothetical protein M1834_004638 [Cirrosporium novae-zelandiae]
MGYCRICLLCGKSIDSTYTGKGIEAWRSWFQILQLEEGAAGNHLIGSSDTYIHTQNVVHAACWIVVTVVLGTSRVDVRWLDRFCHVLRDMKPFMISIKFIQSPDALDYNLNREFSDTTDSDAVKNSNVLGHNPGRKCDNATNSNPVKNPNVLEDNPPRKFHGAIKSNPVRSSGIDLKIPHEIIQIIYSFLNSYKDICSFQQVTHIKPSDKIWLFLAHKYLAVDVQQLTSKAEIVRSTKQALTNLHYFSSSFPHTANYTVVLDNAKLLISKIQYSLTGRDTDIVTSGRDTIFSDPKGSLSKQKEISWSTSQMEFNFSRIRNQYYLCGFCCGGSKLGYDGDLTVKFSPKYLCGMRLISNGKGFIALQIKDQLEWGPVLPGGVTETDLGTCVHAQLEWPSGCKDETFILSFDTIKICALAFAKKKSIVPLVQPAVWQSRLPLQQLKPVILIDRAAGDRIHPYTFIDSNITSITAVNAFVDRRTEAISAIEFVMGPYNVLSIGHKLSSASKLSFHPDLDKHEKVVGLTCAKASSGKNNGISIKFLTSLGRTILFGNEAAKEWCPISSSSHGLFCTSKVMDEYCISIFGVFLDVDNNLDQFLKMPSSENSVKWTSKLINFDNHFEPAISFCSKACMMSIRKIIIYSETFSEKDYLTGMKILYNNRSPDILGQAREEFQTLNFDGLTGTLSELLVYYTIEYGSRYKVRGLTFCCTSQDFQVGVCKASVHESLQINESQDVLDKPPQGSLDLLGEDLTVEDFEELEATVLAKSFRKPLERSSNNALSSREDVESKASSIAKRPVDTNVTTTPKSVAQQQATETFFTLSTVRNLDFVPSHLYTPENSLVVQPSTNSNSPVQNQACATKKPST